MILFLTITLCLAFIIYFSRILIKSRSLKLFPVYNIFIIMTNGIGIPFLKYFDSTKDFPDSQSIQETSLTAITIFMLVCLVFQLAANFFYKKYYYKTKAYFNYMPKVNNVVYYSLILIAIFGFVRFVFISNAIQYMGAIFMASDFREYYFLRATLAYLIVSLPGAGLATVCVSYLNYLLICVASVKLVNSNSFTAKGLNFLIIAFLLMSTLVISAILGRRAPILILVLFTIFILRTLLLENKTRFREKKFKSGQRKLSDYKTFLSTLFVLVFALGIVSLILSNFTSLELNNRLVSGLITLFERLSLIPSGTNNYYYSIFPNVIPFRGILYSFDALDPSFFADIAKLNTGYSFNANTYFVTVAYSGFGFIGVFLVSIAYCIIALYQDSLIFKLKNSRLNVFFYLVNISGMLILSSTSLLSSLIYGFFSPTLLLFSCFKKPRQVSKSVITQP